MISNLDGVPIALHAENHMVQIASLPDHNGVVASADVHFAVVKPCQVANHQSVSRPAADNAASVQSCDSDFFFELPAEGIEKGQMIVNAQQHPKPAPVLFQDCNDLFRIHVQRHSLYNTI